MAELNLLQEKILSDGVIRPGNVLKVDSFLNHQIDVPFISELGKEFKKLFGDRRVDKILTIEASGIGIACLTAVYFGVPVVFAKKSAGSNMDKEMFATEVVAVFQSDHTKNRNKGKADPHDDGKSAAQTEDGIHLEQGALSVRLLWFPVLFLISGRNLSISSYLSFSDFLWDTPRHISTKM